MYCNYIIIEEAIIRHVNVLQISVKKFQYHYSNLMDNADCNFVTMANKHSCFANQ